MHIDTDDQNVRPFREERENELRKMAVSAAMTSQQPNKINTFST
jgi:hypothetical protein